MVTTTPDLSQHSPDLWDSDRARAIIRELIVPEWATAIGEDAAWCPAPTEEVWQALRREVVARSNRGRVAGPTVFLLGVDVAKYAAAGYARFCLRLEAFAELLKAWRAELSERHGPDFWDRGVTGLEDPKEKVVVELLRQLSTRTTPDVIDDLDAIGRRGLRYQIAGGVKRVHRLPDCGIHLMVGAGRRIEERLRRASVAREATAGGQQARAALGDPSSWPRVLLYYDDCVLRVSFKVQSEASLKKETCWCHFTKGKQRTFLLALFSVNKGRMALDKLHDVHTHPGEQLFNPETGLNKKALDRLTQLRRSVENKLTASFGRHPRGMWIHESNGGGYGLNCEGIHWCRCNGKEGGQE